MTDAHCHVVRADAARAFLCDPAAPSAAPPPGARIVRFHGTHPWDAAAFDEDALRAALAADPAAGVGEIGLDRLRERAVTPARRTAFETQLRLAAEGRRPVVLHGAKAWGDVVATIRRLFAPGAGTPPPPPAFLFHGFSRAGGLLPEIVALNGFLSVGPAILNDHAVNYRALVRTIPPDRLLVESDATDATAAQTPPLADILAGLAAVRGESADALAARLEANADRFLAR